MDAQVVYLIVQIWICHLSPMTVTSCYLGGFNARRAVGFLSLSGGLIMWFINQLRQIIKISIFDTRTVLKLQCVLNRYVYAQLGAWPR